MATTMDGQRLTVWAPAAGLVEAVLATGRVPMRQDDHGWWSAETGSVPDGRYAFAVDGADPRPDPRSLSQPDGVHAPSRLVDLTAHRWADDGWAGRSLQGSVIYELHVGTFTAEGTFDAAIQRLDHLVELGVTTVELMPVAAFPGRHGWGYDGVALYAVHEPYGGAHGLQRFVDACHTRSLAVYLDVVYNHLGPSGNYPAQFGPYFTDRYHTPWGQAVNLDGPGSDGVRAFLLGNARMWLEDFHLDGLRLDAVHELHDGRALTLLEELAVLADEVSGVTGVPRTLVAESDRNDPATVSPRGPGGAGGLGLHGQWADDVHHALHVALTGETGGYYGDFTAPGVLGKVLGGSPFLHDGTWSTFRGRVHGRPVDAAVTPPWRFVASLQTHDQVGNRAVGERIGALAGHDRAAVGAALLLTSPYTPMLFMGEEWGASSPWQYFTDHEEAELAEAISQGRRREFADHGWTGAVPDPQAHSTVTASRLDWSEPGEPGHAELLAWYRTLLQLRRELPELAAPPSREAADWSAEVAPDSGLVTVRRAGVLVLANLSAEPVEAALGDDAAVLAAWGEVQPVPESGGVPGRHPVRLGAESVAVVGRASGGQAEGGSGRAAR